MTHDGSWQKNYYLLKACVEESHHLLDKKSMFLDLMDSRSNVHTRKRKKIFPEDGSESVRDGDSRCKDLCGKRVIRETFRVLLDAVGDVHGLSILLDQWHSVNVLESTMIPECKDGRYDPLSETDMKDIRTACLKLG